MGDPLKQFIDDNREHFDSENPGPVVFKNLKKQIGQDNHDLPFLRLRSVHWAAVAAMFLIVSIVLYFTMQPGKNPEIAKETPSIPDEIATYDPVYAKQIDRYQQLIGLQQVELRKVERVEPNLYRQFASDISQLDSAYRVLSETLDSNPNKELLLEAMISNLQLQTELLSRQLSIIKEIKQKSKAHEKSTI